MKKQTKAKLMAILTMLSLVGCKKSEVQVEPSESTIIEITEPTKSYFIDEDGVYHPDESFIKVNGAAFARMSIPLYNSWFRDRERINYVPQLQTVKLLYSNEEFSFVRIEDGTVGYLDNSLITLLPEDYVEIDISDQKVKVVDNNEIVLYCDVVTGKPGHDTNEGLTEVLSKTYNRPMVGPGYRLDVNYCIEFNTSEECFHDNRNRSEFGGEIYKTNGSLGCVNMKLEDVRELDSHVKVGTKVITHK